MNNTAHRQAGHRRARGLGLQPRVPGRTGARGRAALLVTAATVALVLLAGCGPVHLVASTNIPTPLVAKIPIAVALFVPKDFSEFVHKEERSSTDWRVELGRAQTEGITRLMNAMFERVVPVESVAAGSALGSGVRAILEPSIEEYAFVTPRDAGSPFFAVSIKYRVNVYMPDGKLAESWGFTGYGTSPSQGLSHASPLAAATALAMRDAGAKLAVEFREQAVVRGLIPQSPLPDSLSPSPSAASPGPAGGGGQGPATPSSQPATGQDAAGQSPQPQPQTTTPGELPPVAPVGAPEERPEDSQQDSSSAAPDSSAAPPGEAPPEDAASDESDSQESDPPDRESGQQVNRLLGPR